MVKNKSMGDFNDTLLLLTEAWHLILGTHAICMRCAYRGHLSLTKSKFRQALFSKAPTLVT